MEEDGEELLPLPLGVLVATSLADLEKNKTIIVTLSKTQKSKEHTVHT
jgi:hypothetical protein